MSAGTNIAFWLEQSAFRTPLANALVMPSPKKDATAITFGEFDTCCDQIVRRLNRIGVAPGMVTILMTPPGLEFAVFTFALFRLGATPVLIDPGMGVRGIAKCITDARPIAFIGSAKAHWARRFLRWGRRTIQILVRTSNRTIRSDQSLSFRLTGSRAASIHPAADSDVAAILFTSGSTGPAKGAVYTHGMFQEQVRVLQEVFDIHPGEVDLCTFPLFALFAPALGMTSIVPDMDPTRPAKADPNKLIKAIIDYKVTNLFGSPALINVLSRYGEQHNIKLPMLRRVISAGAPVSARIVERMAKMLSPGVQVFTPYGATESLPVAVIGSDEILNDTRYRTDQGAGICVGRLVGRIDVRVIGIDDGPLNSDSPAFARRPRGEYGEICVRGPVVSQSYWNRPDADALHKVCDGETFWHRTGDIGYFDEIGRLWFCGRKAHRVQLPEQTLFTIPVEAVFNTHPDVFRTALVGVVRNGQTYPVLCVELESECRRSPKDIVPELATTRDRFPHTAPIRDFLFHRGFPVDVRHNAKIHREKLATWAARRLR